MPEFSHEDQERAKDWLRRHAAPEDGRRGLSSYEIRDILKPFGRPSQRTVARAILDLAAGDDLKRTMMRAILARLAFEEAETKRITDAKATVTQPPPEADNGVASTVQAERHPAVNEQWREQQKERVYELLWAAIGRQVERGLVPETDLDKGIVRGDGIYYLDNLKSFTYQDERAEAIGFLNDGDILPDGRTAGFYTEGVSPEWRQLKSALPVGASRNRIIGNRPANLVPIVPYFDKRWFWDQLAGMVDRWRALLRRFESWITDGVPKVVSREEAANYEKLLRLTAEFHQMDIAYEGPEPNVTFWTLYETLNPVWFNVRRREEFARAKGWAARLAGLGLLGIVHSWVLLSAAPDLISFRETVEGWRTTGWHLGAELLLLLTSPQALAISLVLFTLLFLVSAFRTGRPWYRERRAALRWTRVLGTLVVLVAVSLMPSLVAFGELPGL